MSKLLTAEELSKLLRLPRRSVYKFAQEGQLPGTLKIGKHWRFSEDAINVWIKGETKRQSVAPKK